jgi:hypothetical protein
MSLGIGPTLGVEWEHDKYKYTYTYPPEDVKVVTFERLGGGHFQFLLKAEDSQRFTGEGIFKFRYLHARGKRKKKEIIYERDGIEWRELMWDYHYDFVLLTLALFLGRKIKERVYELGFQLEVYLKEAVSPLGAIVPFPSLFARIRF